MIKQALLALSLLAPNAFAQVEYDITDWHPENAKIFRTANGYMEVKTKIPAWKLKEIAEHTSHKILRHQLLKSLENVDDDSLIEIDYKRPLTKEELEDRRIIEAGIHYDMDSSVWMPRGGEASPDRSEGHDFENARDVDRHRLDPEKEREIEEAREARREKEREHQRELEKIKAKTPCEIEWQIEAGQKIEVGGGIESPVAGGNVDTAKEATRGVRVKVKMALDPLPCMALEEELRRAAREAADHQ